MTPLVVAAVPEGLDVSKCAVEGCPEPVAGIACVAVIKPAGGVDHLPVAACPAHIDSFAAAHL